MFSNQQPSLYTTRHYIHDSQSNSRNNSNLSFDRSHSPQSAPYFSNYQPPTSTTYFNDRSNFGQQQQQPIISSYGSSSAINYVPPNSTSYSPVSNHIQRSSSGSIGKGAIEKTNMMSSENPFYDPARPYEHLISARTITSITSPRKSNSAVNKTLNLSDENPFHAIYGGYHYPSHKDPSKRITNQTTNIRSTDKKSLNLSDENPFFSTYERYHYPPQIDPQKRITEISKVSGPLISTNELSDDNPFINFRPSLIRQYSASGGSESGLNPFPTSIADWTRNNPAPLSYRPIQVQRPPPDFYNQNESFNTSSYVPPISPPRQQRQISPSPPPTRIQSQYRKSNSSAPLNKTSLNMSPDNPFADTYGRYYYPSPEEIKAQKRTNEHNNRFTEQQSINDNRTTQPTNQIAEYPETEKKDITSGKGNTKFARFDVTV